MQKFILSEQSLLNTNPSEKKDDNNKPSRMQL